MKKNVRMILILFCITSLLSGCALLPFSDDNPFAKQGEKKKLKLKSVVFTSWAPVDSARLLKNAPRKKDSLSVCWTGPIRDFASLRRMHPQRSVYVTEKAVFSYQKYR